MGITKTDSVEKITKFVIDFIDTCVSKIEDEQKKKKSGKKANDVEDDAEQSNADSYRAKSFDTSPLQERKKDIYLNKKWLKLF